MIDDLRDLLGNLSKAYRAKNISERDLEHRLLEIISHELQHQKMDNPTWLKAFSEAEGNDSKAKAYYIRYRLRRLHDDVLLAQMAEHTERSANRVKAVEETQRLAKERRKREAAVEREKSLRAGRFILFFLIILGTGVLSFLVFFHLFSVIR
jgi:hypothetical protein